MAREPILKIDEMDSGLWPSLAQDEVPLWAEGENFLFNEKVIQPYPGQFTLLLKPASNETTGGVEALLDGKKTLFWGDNGALYRFLEGKASPDDITKTGLTAGYDGIADQSTTEISTRWSMDRFGRWIVATNGQNTPQVYKGAAEDPAVALFIDLPGFTTTRSDGRTWNTAEIFVAFEQHLHAFGIRENGTLGGGANPDLWDGASDIGDHWVWSGAQDPEIWDPGATNQAGDLQIAGLNSDVMAAVSLGTALGIYGLDKMFLGRFIGSPLYYGFREAMGGIGAVSKHAVARVGKHHYGMGQEGFWVTDGSSFEYVDQPAIHDFVFGEGGLNRAQMSKCAHLHVKSQSHVTWFYPSGASLVLDKAVTFNYRTRRWSIPGFVRSFGSSGEIWGFPLAFDVKGNVFIVAVEGSVPASDPIGSPLTLGESATIDSKFGQLDFGHGAFGGKFTL